MNLYVMVLTLARHQVDLWWLVYYKICFWSHQQKHVIYMRLQFMGGTSNLNFHLSPPTYLCQCQNYGHTLFLFRRQKKRMNKVHINPWYENQNYDCMCHYHYWMEASFHLTVPLINWFSGLFYKLYILLLLDKLQKQYFLFCSSNILHCPLDVYMSTWMYLYCHTRPYLGISA